MVNFETNRLILRQWHESDLRPFIEMNSDAEVMQYFPSVYTQEQSIKMYEDCCTKNDQMTGWKAVEEKSSGEFVGFVGLNNPAFMPEATEIGWRLRQKFWGKGYASEAARKWLEIGFDKLNLTEIISFTTEKNLKSQAVMEKIGMKRDRSRDFYHPNLPLDHHLSFHVFYSKSNGKISGKT